MRLSFRRVASLVAALFLSAASAEAQPVVQLFSPVVGTASGLAVDSAGNVTFADPYNAQIRRMGPGDGYAAVSTLRQTLGQTSLVAIDSHGDIFVAGEADTPDGGGVLSEVNASSGYTTVIRLPSPGQINGIAIDKADNLYISDFYGSTVWESTAADNYQALRSLGGKGTPGRLAIDAQGDVFATNSSNGSVFEIVAVDGSIPASPTIRQLISGLQFPGALALDGNGNLFVADMNGNVVKEITAASDYAAATTLTTAVAQPNGLTLDSDGNLFISSSGTTAIQELTAAGGYATLATLAPSFVEPWGLTTDQAGDLYVADAGTATVYRLPASSDYASAAQLFNGVIGPIGVALDSAGNIFVADADGHAVKEILVSTGYNSIVSLGSGFNRPTGIALDSAGNVFVTDYNNSAVKEILAAGGFATVRTLGSGFNHPTGIAVDSNDNVFVADTRNGVVKELRAADGYSTAMPLGGSVGIPDGLALDAAGNVYVTSYASSVVIELTAASNYITTKTIGNFRDGTSDPIAIDGHGNIYVVALSQDQFNDIVDEILAAPPALLASVLPNARSVADGATATVFATMINTSAAPLDNCRVVIRDAENPGVTLDYQTTDPATNAPTGTANTPVKIPGGNGVQSFVLSFPDLQIFPGIVPDYQIYSVPLTFTCDGASPAPFAPLVTGFQVNVNGSPVPDIIALAATASNDGILHAPLGGSAAFAVATSNIGATASGVPVTAYLTSTDENAGTVTLCQTNPSSGLCLAPPASSLSADFAAGATPTFSVFVTPGEALPFDPANMRVVVLFGSFNTSAITSVAIETQ